VGVRSDTPQKKPDFALWYLLDRYVLQIEDCTQIRPENLVPTEDVEAALHSFLRSTDKRVTVVLYPDKPESLDRARWRQTISPHVELLRRAGVARIIDVMDDPRWSHGYYRDGIHPTPQGYAVLARIISDNDH